jgi:pre-mRNA-processing factor 39
MALVDLGIERSPVDTDLILTTFNNALSSELPEEQKVTFAHRKIEFLEDYGMDVESINKAQDELQRLAKLLREKKAAAALAAATASVDKGDDKKASNADESSKSEVAATNGTAAYDQYAYGQQYNQYGNYANWNYQQSTGYGYSQQGWNAYQGYYG